MLWSVAHHDRDGALFTEAEFDNDTNPDIKKLAYDIRHLLRQTNRIMKWLCKSFPAEWSDDLNVG